MHQYQLTGAGGLDSVVLVETQKPVAGRGQVLVRMHAASLNYRDLIVMSGGYSKFMFTPPNLVPLSDGAGEVVAIGEDVTQFKPGDKVCGAFTQGWIGGEMKPSDRDLALGGGKHGVLTEYRVFDETGLVAMPSNLSYAEAATLPCAGVTAWTALFDSTKPVGPGQSVLVLGTGGVSIFAAQFAKLAGARVIATSSSNDKLDRLKAIGVSDGINYRDTPEWGAEVRKLTGGRGVDVVVETGGAGTLAQSMIATRFGGTAALVGVLTQGEINPTGLMLGKITARPVTVGSRQDFEAMNRAIEIGGLKPVIEKIYPFAETKAAYAALSEAKHIGKIVIQIAE